MNEIIEQMILECYKSMIECIKNDNLELAIKYQDMIKDYKEQLDKLSVPIR